MANKIAVNAAFRCLCAVLALSSLASAKDPEVLLKVNGVPVKVYGKTYQYAAQPVA